MRYIQAGIIWAICFGTLLTSFAHGRPGRAGATVVELTEKAGIELSIYEGNHHTTHGDAPLEPRNKIVASIGGGISVANNMLMMMRERMVHSVVENFLCQIDAVLVKSV